MLHRRSSLASAILLTVAVASGCSSSPEPSAAGSSSAADAGTTEPAAPPTCPEGDTFKDMSGKVVVKVSLNGGPAKSWVLDTGNPSTVVDETMAAELEGKDVVTIAVGGITKELPRKRVRVGDVRATTKMDIAGILGHDVFGEVLTLDYPRGRFWIAPELDDAGMRACAHVRGEPKTVDAVYDLFVYVRGSAEGKPGWFLVDSGASLGAMPSSVFDALQAANPRPYVEGFYTPAAIGTFWSKLTSIQNLDVGGARVTNILTRTMDDGLLTKPKGAGDEPILGVLPSGFLRHFMLTVDFKANKVRLDAAKDDAREEPTSAFPIGIGLEAKEATPVHVTQVLEGSSAAEAGIQVGDELVAIGGTPLASLDTYSRAWRIVGQTTGEKIKVTVKRGDAESTHELVTRDLLKPPALP